MSRRWRQRLLPPITRERQRRGLPAVWSLVRRLVWAWWIWAGVAVWALTDQQWGWFVGASMAAAIAHLAAPRERAPTYGLEHPLEVGDPSFLASLEGLTGARFVGGNRVSVLQNGDAFFPAMLESIRGARASVTMEAYIYWHGQVGLEFARALAERSQAGVSVKILLDAIGSASIGEEILKVLQAGGCQLAWFNPLRWQTIGQINYRTHRKTIVVDGAVGFTGGAGIADIWTGNAERPGDWRDTQVRVEGPAVVPLQTGFAQNWLQATGELVSGERYFPVVERAGDVEVQMMMSSPSSGASSARLLYYLPITAARESILIANPYFVPDRAAIDSFGAARDRGVRIRLMLTGRHNDTRLVRLNSVRLYGALLEAGVELYEFNRTMLHQKTMVVDGRWATVGSANFDSRSFSFNQESNLSFVDPTLVAELVRAFENDLSGCDRVSMPVWRQRGWPSRAAEIGASLFKEQV